MIRITNEEELLGTFRSIDRDEVQIPLTARFPMAVKDYVAWIEPSGHRIYLVFEDTQTGSPLGVVFQRTRGSANTVASMCQWCHAVRSGSGVGLLTATVAKDHRVGVHLCADLNCREHAMGPPGIHDFNESLSSGEKLQNILRRMTAFARKNLF